MSASSPRAYGEEARRIAAGGLPDSAERRLAQLRASGVFSSFFSARAWALGGDAQVEPLGQVIGASACRLGRGVRRRTQPGTGRLPLGAARWHELDGVIRSWTTVRQRALSRLAAEAASLGADGVLGVSVRRGERMLEESDPLVEMVFEGTAVCLPRAAAKRTGEPLLSPVTARDYWALSRAGLEPVGIAGSCASVSTQASYATVRALSGRRSRSVNLELEDFTRGIYEARKLAIERLHADASTFGATGLLGVNLEQIYSGDTTRSGRRDVTLHLLATAVRRRRSASATRPRPVLGQRA